MALSLYDLIKENEGSGESTTSPEQSTIKNKIVDDDTAVKELSSSLNVPPQWINNLIAFESKWDPKAKNPNSGARGLIQFTHSTAQDLGYDSADDLVVKHPDRVSQLMGPVKDYLSKMGPFKDERDFQLSVFYPRGRRQSDKMILPAEVRDLNPGINTVGDYSRKLSSSIAQEGNTGPRDFINPDQGATKKGSFIESIFSGEMPDKEPVNFVERGNLQTDTQQPLEEPVREGRTGFFDYKNTFATQAPSDRSQRIINVESDINSPSQVVRKVNPDIVLGISPDIGSGLPKEELRKPTGEGRRIPENDNEFKAFGSEALRSLTFGKPDAITEERMKAYPAGTVAGEVAGMVAPAFAGGAGMQNVLMKIPRIAQLAKAGKIGKTAFDAITRSATAGTDFVVRNKEELLSSDDTVREKAIKNLAINIASSGLSPLPENFLPKGMIQPVAQMAADGIVNTIGQAAAGDNAWNEENISGTIASIITSGLFSMNDMRKPIEINTKIKTEDVSTTGETIPPKQEGFTNEEKNQETETVLNEEGNPTSDEPPSNSQPFKPQRQLVGPSVLRSITGRTIEDTPKSLPEPEDAWKYDPWNEGLDDFVQRTETVPDENGSIPHSSLSKFFEEDGYGDKEYDKQKFLTGLFTELRRPEQNKLSGEVERISRSDLKSIKEGYSSNAISDIGRKRIQKIVDTYNESDPKQKEMMEEMFDGPIEHVDDVIRALSRAEASNPKEFSAWVRRHNEKNETPDYAEMEDHDAMMKFFDSVDKLSAEEKSADDNIKFSDESEDLFAGTEFADERSKIQKEVDRINQENARKTGAQDKGTEGLPLFDKNEQEAMATKQEDLFKGTTANASIGEYTPRKKPAVGMELPEIVEIIKENTGLYPKIKKALLIKLARGLAKGKSIELLANIFEDLEQAEKATAHEFGHVLDLLSKDKETMARGNLLGRMASLYNYGKSFLEAYPGAPGPLTPEDKIRLKTLSRKMTSKPFNKMVDETIRTETLYTPDDILNIWNSLDKEKIDPKLYDYMARLSAAEKKSIVLQAIKGSVSESVPKKVVETTVNRRMEPGFKDDPVAAAKKYQELIAEEIRKRGLYELRTVRNELINISKLWRGDFDVKGKDPTSVYRKKGTELYADAISVLLNEPSLLAEKAPNFYRGLMSYIDRKPKFKKVWEDIQDRLYKKGPEVQDRRIERIKEGFKAKEEQDKAKWEKRLKEDKLTTGKVKQGLKEQFFEKNAPLEIIGRALKAIGSSAKNPYLLARELPYISSKIMAYTSEVKDQITKSLGWSSQDKEDLGLYMLLRRASGERAKMANTEGVGGQYAEESLAHLEKTWGKERFNKIKDTAEKYADIRAAEIIPELTSDNTLSEELREKIVNNREYAKVDIVKDFEKENGRQATSSIFGMHSQHGTLRAQGNPFISTVINDMMLLRSKHRSDLVRATIEGLKLTEGKTPYKIEPAKRGSDGKWENVNDDEMRTVYWMDEGKVQAANVSKEIGDLLSYDPQLGNVAIDILRKMGNFSRSVFVKYNPAFLMRNPPRDIMGFAMNVPQANIRSALKYTIKAFPEAWKLVKKGELSDDMKSAMKEMAIPVSRSYEKERILSQQDELERQLAVFHGDEDATRNWISRSFKKIDKFFEAVGQLQEKSVKLGGYKFLKENVKGMSAQERAQIVRARVGTPDAFAGGHAKQWLNNIFIFSNVNLQGLRGSYEAYKDDPKRFATKLLMYDIAPKAAMLAIEAGLAAKVLPGITGEFAEWLQEAYERIPEYHKARVNVVPLPFRTESGKQWYMKIPTDYTGQTVGAMFYEAMKGDFKKVLTEGASTLPVGSANLNTGLEIAKTWMDYATKGNAVDSWSGYPIIPKEKEGAGLSYELPEMAKWTFNNMGGNIWFTIPDNYDLRKKDGWEKAIGLPGGIGSSIKAFIDVSDRGLQDSKSRNSVRNQVKRNRLDKNEKIEEHFTEKMDNRYDRSAVRALYQQLKKDSVDVGKFTDFNRTYKNMVLKKASDPEIQKIARAQSIEERKILVTEYLDSRNMAGEERKREERRMMNLKKLFTMSQENNK